MYPKVKYDLAEDRGEQKLEQEDIPDCEAVMESLMYGALATGPGSSNMVVALSYCKSQPFTSHMTAAKRDFQYAKSTAELRLLFNGIVIPIAIGIRFDIDISNSLVRYSDSV